MAGKKEMMEMEQMQKMLAEAEASGDHARMMRVAAEVHAKYPDMEMSGHMMRMLRKGRGSMME